MILKAYCYFVILLLLVIVNIECTYSKPNNYSIGFENYNRVNGSGHSIGFENVHDRVGRNNQTSGHKPGHFVSTSPSRRPPITTVRPGKPKVTKRPIQHVTTMRPSHPKVTNRPKVPSSSKKPIVTSRKPPHTSRPVTSKPTKPKATHPTTKKPTVPTLPPSIYLRPNFSKVVLPPINSGIWPHQPPPPIWQPPLNTTSAREPLLFPTTTPPNKNMDFQIFYDYLNNFTRKSEHTKEGVYERNKGDTFTYYFQISNYYYNRRFASSFYKVYANNLKNCAINTTKVMCLANTNAVCLTNGTMMCVTHLSAAILCENNTRYCAITYLPCDAKYQSCVGNDKLYVGVPCVSKLLLLPSTNDFYQHITVSPIEYCVTSVIQPKKLYSAIGSYLSYMVESAKKQYLRLKEDIYKFTTVRP